MAAAGRVLVYVGSSLGAFAILVGGLLVLAVYPLIGTLLTLGGMALLLYGTAGLCGAQIRGKQQENPIYEHHLEALVRALSQPTGRSARGPDGGCTSSATGVRMNLLP